MKIYFVTVHACVTFFCLFVLVAFPWKHVFLFLSRDASTDRMCAEINQTTHVLAIGF